METKRPYLKNIMTLSIGSIIAQLFNLLSQPVLTRLVSAQVIGQYSYIVNLANVVIPVASLKLDLLIVKEKDDEQAQYITDVCFSLLLVVSLLFSIILLFGYIFDSSEFRRYGWLLILAVALVITEGSRYIVISYCNRYKQYKKISAITIIREASRAFLQILDAVLLKSVIGQTVAHILSPIFGSGKPFKNYLTKRKQRPKINREKFKNVMVAGKKQVLFIAPSQFLNTFAYSMIAFTIADLFTDQQLGYYSISIKILGLPMMYITTNISKVIFKSISDRLTENKHTFKFLLKNTLVLSVISVVGFSLLYFIAPRACELIFGSGYSIAGEYIKVLCLMYAMRFVSTSFTGLFTVYDKQCIELLFNGLLFIGAALSFAIVKALNENIIQYLEIVNAVSALVYFIQIISYCFVAYKADRRIQEDSKKEI